MRGRWGLMQPWLVFLDHREGGGCRVSQGPQWSRKHQVRPPTCLLCTLQL